jgi:propanediol dehydratase large subunit
LIALLSTMTFVAGCAGTPEPIYVYETVEVVRDRYVSVPEAMTKPVEIVDLSSAFDVFELGAAYSQQRTRTIQCNGQLAEIANITD